MTARRALPALLVVAALAAPGADAARPAPQLRDAAGDWALEGQDIVSGRFSSVLVQGVPHLRGELTLAAAPAGAQDHYMLRFVHGCDEFTFFAFLGPNVTNAPQGRFEKRTYCFQRDVDDVPDTYPVTFSMRGSTATWLVRYAGGVRRGSTPSRFTASAFTVSDRTAVGPVGPEGGDTAQGGDGVYVVGSDLPRR